jgi:hypothetical protein
VSRQYFADVNADTPIANLTAVTATTETGLWVVPQYSPIHAYEARPGKWWKLTAGGIMSWAATGTLIITPRVGTTTGGITLGANVVAVATPGATTAHAWTMEFNLVCRTLGAAGANSTFIGTGFLITGVPAAPGANTAGNTVSFGGTSASADYTIETGLFIGWTLSVAGTVTPQYVHWQSMN